MTQTGSGSSDLTEAKKETVHCRLCHLLKRRASSCLAEPLLTPSCAARNSPEELLLLRAGGTLVLLALGTLDDFLTT